MSKVIVGENYFLVAGKANVKNKICFYGHFQFSVNFAFRYTVNISNIYIFNILYFFFFYYYFCYWIEHLSLDGNEREGEKKKY